MCRRWYSVIVSYRENRLYNNDVNDNCVLEWYEFGEWNYGHSIRESQKHESDSGNYAAWIYGSDNYIKTKSCNIYRMAQKNKLIENNVFFTQGYFYSFIEAPMSTVILPQHIQPSEGPDREIVLAWENIMKKYMESWGKPTFQNYLDNYALTRMLIEIHDLRKKWFEG